MASGDDRPRDIGAPPTVAEDDLDLLRRRLANVIGHALRTPAATVRGHAEVLASTDDPAAVAESVAGLRRAARRLEEMIDEVLVVEGIETRLPTSRPLAVDLGVLVHEVADGLEVVAEVEVVGDGEARVRGAPDGVRWVLRHLLDNAGRYGQGAVRVELTAGEDTVRARITTPAGGVGATDDDLRLAFEPFYRGERAVTVTATRLGVGLTVVRRLVAQLAGEVHLEREGETGVAAVLELPRA